MLLIKDSSMSINTKKSHETIQAFSAYLYTLHVRNILQALQDSEYQKFWLYCVFCLPVYMCQVWETQKETLLDVVN